MKDPRKLPLSTNKAIALAAMFGGAVLGLIFSQFSWDLGMVLSFLVVIAGIVWHILFVKCPYCGHCFGPRERISNFCPHCGRKLE